jgi:hypothetical protein
MYGTPMGNRGRIIELCVQSRNIDKGGEADDWINEKLFLARNEH